MGKGVILKSKKKENIYPVTASDLVYDPITKKNVKDELGGKVEEAPKDGEQYARVNGAWSKVEAGAVSETALITLTPAVADLNGVTVKVTTNEGESLLDTTWNGTQLSVQVRAGLQYTVAVGDKEGFITPEAVTYTAIKGSTRSINMSYIESKLKVNILSNQENDSAISNVKATVKYGSTSVQVANGGIVALPMNTSVTITFPSVNGYKAPETISYTHTSGSYEKSGTYKTELVKVTLSADNGDSVIGQTVTIDGVQYTWKGTAISQKVAFGKQYTVSVNDKDGYTSPNSQSFTASQSVRNLELVYMSIKMGVFIQGVSGKLYTKELWDEQENAQGIAILTDNCKIVMPILDYEWISTPELEEIENASFPLDIMSSQEAKLDFNGENNTKMILDWEETEGYELSLLHDSEISDYVFPNGEKGYLGSVGEYLTIFDNIDEINEILALFEFGELSGYVWSSSRCEDVDDKVWLWRILNGSLYSDNNWGSSITKAIPLIKY